MKQLVSVVTLTYKKFDNIFKTIDSVLAQDYPNIEYIISDDGSDNIPISEICLYVEKNRRKNIVLFKLFTHTKNQGTVKNINEAYRYASGDIIMPLAGDDEFYDESVVSRVVHEFDVRNCKALTVGRMEYKDGIPTRIIPSEKEKKYIDKWTTNKKQYEAFISGLFYECCSGCVLYLKKSFIEEWGYFDERYFLWEDGPFYAQYLWKYKMEFAFDIIGIKYNLGGVSSGKKHPRLLEDAEIYDQSDAIEHLHDISWHTKEIIRFSLLRKQARNKKEILESFIRHPFGLIQVVRYRYKRTKLSGDDWKNLGGK